MSALQLDTCLTDEKYETFFKNFYKAETNTN
jgi:hypothetical protein